MVTLYLTNSANNGFVDKIADENNLLLSKVTGVTDLLQYVKEECAKMQHITTFIIDLSAFENNKPDDIIAAVERLRQMYGYRRIIIIALGYEENSLLLGRIFTMGIYNIATGNSLKELEENVRLCFSKEGKQYNDSIKFKPLETTMSGSEKIVVKEKPALIKPYVTVGLCGIENHIGTTHHALAITRYLSKMGLKSCYVEANNHNRIEEIKNFMVNIKVVDGMLIVDHLKIFPNAGNYTDILKQDFAVYVFDYGTIEQMRSFFLTMDLKIIISGGKPWELNKYLGAFSNMQGIKGLSSIMNFVPKSLIGELSDFISGCGINNVYFAEYTPNPFEDDGNHDVYGQICKQVIATGNGVLEDKNKKKWFFWR